jgi:C1A family cysteine protease
MTSYRKTITLLVGIGLIASSQFGFASLSLQSVKNQIHAKKKSWVAGETSMSVQGPEAVKKMLGANFETADSTVKFGTLKDDDNPFPFPFPFPFFPDDDDDDNDDDKDDKTPVASALDWRNHNGVDYSSPILNQGHCGSCVAFAAVGALETQLNITRGTSLSPWAFLRSTCSLAVVEAAIAAGLPDGSSELHAKHRHPRRVLLPVPERC